MRPLAGRHWLVRVSLVGVIGFALPFKSWLEEVSVGKGGQERLGSVSADSTHPKQGDATWSGRNGGGLTESNYDLSLPGLSIPTPAKSQVNHSPSLAALRTGELAMSWFGGSREGARDVQIFFAKFDGVQWSEARVIMGTDQLMQQTGRYLTKLGNPMLYFDGERLHCWFVSVSLGGWGGARINHMVSLNAGESWSVPKLLVASPFLNVSTLVRSTALAAMPESKLGMPAPKLPSVSRETLLPAYFELSQKYPVMIRVDMNSRILDRYPFGGRVGLLQPSVVRAPSASNTGGGNAATGQAATPPATQNPNVPLVTFFRRGQAVSEAKVFTSRSLDDGQTWSAAQPIGIPNGDASVVAWADQTRIWLIANPELDSRRAIASFKLPDSLPFSGELAPTQILDQVPATISGHQEFSYPSFAKTSDARLHLVYTADGRKGIRHRIWVPQPNTARSDGKHP